MSRWQHVQDVFHAALEKDSGERAAFIGRACDDDGELRREVEALVASHRAAAGAFIEQSRADEVAELLEDAPQREDRLLGRRVGSYRIVRVIGSGGMGTVYEALQEQPQRTVALKVMKPALASRSAVRRFVEESQILARLRHPGLAQVYEAGTFDDDGAAVPYFAMEFLPQARTIIDYAAERDLSIHGRLELFAAVCDAVHHAHARGVIHRDLKPANILVVNDVEADGLKPACPIPKVIDFGVARATDSDVAITTLRSDAQLLIGTLQYMSPEQCAGDPRGIDARSDVYALGVVLFELLSGRLPYDLDSKSIPEAARVIGQQEPARLSSINRMFRGDLDTIVSKALEKDRERRYPSAAALAADIRRHLGDEPIEARPASVMYQLSKFARRNKGVVAGAVGILLTLLAGLVVSTVLYVRADTARRAESQQSAIASQKAREASEARDEAVFREYVADIAAASAAIRANDVGDARKRLEQAPEHLRNFEWHHLRRCLDRSLLTFAGHSEPVNTLALSPDGRVLASGSSDNTIRFWNIDTAEQLAVMDPHTDVVTSIVFSRDGRRLLSASADRTVRLWDVALRQVIHTFTGHTDHVYRAVFSPDERLIVSCSKDQTIRVWDASTGDTLHVLATHTDRVHSVTFSPDGRLLASSSWDGAVKLWDATTFAELATLAGHDGAIYRSSFSPDGGRLASASSDHTVRIWDVASRQTVLVLRGHTDAVSEAVFDSVGKRIATASADRTLRVWDAESGAPMTCLLGHSAVVRTVMFMPDDTHLISASTDATIKRWDVGADLVPTLRGYAAWVYDVAFNAKGTLLATVGGGRSPGREITVRLWNVARREQAMTLEGGDTGLVFCVACSPDGARLACGSADGIVRLWDARDWATHAELKGHEGLVRDVAFSPDGARLASVSADRTVRLWDLTDDREPLVLDDHGGPVNAVVFLAGGARLASGDSSGRITVWDARSGEAVTRWVAHDGAVTGLAGSADQRLLASASADGSVKVWDVHSAVLLATLPGHSYRVQSVSFSPDGTRLASAGDDYAIRLWDTATWREVATLHGHTNLVWAVQFSPDGQTLASGSADLTARLWDAAPTPQETK